MSRFVVLIQVVFFLLLFLGGLAWTIFQWLECRDMGFSVFYCIQHIA